MKNSIKPALLSFYFGSLSENERLIVEKELLMDPGLLTEFFDLKRNIEASDVISQGPSLNVWTSVQTQLTAKKKWMIPISFGAALAASVVAFFIFLETPKQEKLETGTNQTELIFDSGSELPVSSNVL